jgi:hypothetical protein
MILEDAEIQAQEEPDDEVRPTKEARRVPWLEKMGLGR